MKLSAWDRMWLRLAPRWAVNRMRARQAAEILARHYEAAASGRRTSGWPRKFGDGNTVNAVALTELRAHARDLIRNNSWAKRGQRVIANNTAGWGLVPKAVGSSAAAAMPLWKKWAGSTECEAEGRHTFYGLQQIVMRTIAVDGEVLIRRRQRRPSDGLAVPLQLQVLEADFLDIQQDGFVGLSGGPTIQGVEYDRLGRRAAYWVFPEHPGSSNATRESRRIPATEILHVFYAERPSVARGVSWFGSAIVNLKDLDDYEDAELVKQKIAACFAAFVTDTDGTGSAIGEQDEDDPLIETFEPGMIHQLPVGKAITVANPPTVTEGAFAQRNLRRIAAGLGVTYEDLTGDYSQVNFSSARMARLAHWANVDDWRYNMLIPLLCDGVWRWAMESLQIAGVINEVPAAEWTTPPMPMIEPDKEALAVIRRVRGGLLTPSGMIREQGLDPEAHFAEYAADMAKLDTLKIKIDGDVRAVSQAGLTQERVGGGGGGGAPPADDSDS